MTPPTRDEETQAQITLRILAAVDAFERKGFEVGAIRISPEGAIEVLSKQLLSEAEIDALVRRRLSDRQANAHRFDLDPPSPKPVGPKTE